MCDRCKELEKKLKKKDKALDKKHKNNLDLLRMMEIVRKRSRGEAERYISKYLHAERMLYDIRELVNNEQALQLQELIDRREAMKKVISKMIEHMKYGAWGGWNCEILGILKDADDDKREGGWGLKKYHQKKSCGAWCRSREQLIDGE